MLRSFCNCLLPTLAASRMTNKTPADGARHDRSITLSCASLLPLLMLLMLSSLPAQARKLDPAHWRFNGPNARDMRKAVDNDIDTCWNSGVPQAPGQAMVIDLGRHVAVYKVALTPGKEYDKFPRALNVYVGETPDKMTCVARHEFTTGGDTARAGGEKPNFHLESSFRFAPVEGRYVKLELGANTSGFSWAIAELEIHAATRSVDAQAMTVLLPSAPAAKPGAAPAPPPPLALAAKELQYYLMELLDVPVNIINPAEVKGDTGLRFRLVMPPPEKLPYPEPDPKYLEDVSVIRAGNELQFSGPTQRAVLYSVYEFLFSQGVRWLYPDTHGDWVPPRVELDLSVLPISYRPPFSTRNALFSMIGSPVYARTEEASLYLLRQCFNLGDDMDRTSLGGIPPRANLGSARAHSMGALVGEQGDKTHPEFWIGPYRSGGPVPCTSNPALVDFLMTRFNEISDKYTNTYHLPAPQGWGVHPLDTPAFCECDRCVKLFGKPEKFKPAVPDTFAEAFNYSDYHFHLINEVAKRLHQQHPDQFVITLAYANHSKPPQLIDKLPENVLVDIASPWINNLPPSSPKNQVKCQLLKAWSTKCSSLGVWEYVLLYQDLTYGRPAGDQQTVVPMVSSLVEQNQYLHKLGFRAVSTQGMGELQHIPWALYAYSRSTWKPDEKPAVVLEDFFRGYYQEAWKPMLAWYNILENEMLAKDISMWGQGVCSTGVYAPPAELFSADIVRKMRVYGKQAGMEAKSWYVKERVARANTDLEWSYQMAQRTSPRVSYPCYRVTTPPVMDGTLHDPVWQTLPECDGFRLLCSRLGMEKPGRYAALHTTHFRFGWDDKYLYLAVRCSEPDMAKLKELDAKDTKFSYREVLEMFFAPQGLPDYLQTMVSSSGYQWGPMRVQHVNAYVPDTHTDDFTFKTGYEAGAWIVEARFPLSHLDHTPPVEGTRWSVNLARASALGTDAGEGMSQWADITEFSFHERNRFNWVEFHKAALPREQAASVDKTLDADAAGFRRLWAEHELALGAFAEEIKDKENLGVKAQGAQLCWSTLPLIYRGDLTSPPFLEIRWPKPVLFDAVRLNWGDRRMSRQWYSLEYWDGARYHLLAEQRDNLFPVSIQKFAPITTDRLRVIVWGELNGWKHLPLFNSVDVYKRKN